MDRKNRFEKYANRTSTVINPINTVESSTAEISEDGYTEEARQDMLAYLYAAGWDNVYIDNGEEELPDEVKYYHAVKNNVEKEVNKNRKLVARMRESERRVTGVYTTKLQDKDWFNNMNVFENMRFNEEYIYLLNKYKDSGLYDVSEIDFDQLVELYKAGIINEDATNAYSRLKQIEIMLAAEDYVEVNYNDDVISAHDKLKSTKATDDYLMKLINGDI